MQTIPIFKILRDDTLLIDYEKEGAGIVFQRNFGKIENNLKYEIIEQITFLASTFELDVEDNFESDDENLFNSEIRVKYKLIVSDSNILEMILSAEYGNEQDTETIELGNIENCLLENTISQISQDIEELGNA